MKKTVLILAGCLLLGAAGCSRNIPEKVSEEVPGGGPETIQVRATTPLPADTGSLTAEPVSGGELASYEMAAAEPVSVPADGGETEAYVLVTAESASEPEDDGDSGLYEMVIAEPASEPEDGGDSGLYEMVIAEPAFTLEDVREVRFDDVPEEDERADPISYAAYSGYLQGVGGGRFQPDGFVTRGELITVLHRMSGAEKSNYIVLTPDVKLDMWYAEAISWALETGVAFGGEDGNFAPEKRVTREELAVFLHRFAAGEDSQVYDTSLEDYLDGAFIQAYAREALAWALENRIYAGMVGDTIHPFLPVSRGQLAQVLTALTAYMQEEPVAGELTEKLHTEIVESVSQARHEEIQAQVDAAASRYGAAGVQVAVVESGQLTDTYVYGWATRSSDRMTPEHKIRTASLTKVGVGLAAMILYEDGVIDLDEGIGTYWGVQTKNPYYPDDPVTIRSLLTHTSSIPVLGDDASRTYDSVRYRLASNSYSRVRPGSVWSWSYNNYAYGVLGQTLELASGKYLDDILRERLWDIMDIDAAFESGEIRNTDLLATIYRSGGVGRSAGTARGIARPEQPGATGTYFSGGLTISAADMGKMVGMLASGGSYEGLRLLKRSTIDAMQTRLESRLGDGTYQALALRSQDDLYGRARIYYHTGSAYGVFNLFSYDPSTGDGVVVLTTGASGVKDGRNIYAVCSKISEYIYETIA